MNKLKIENILPENPQMEAVAPIFNIQTVNEFNHLHRSYRTCEFSNIIFVNLSLGNLVLPASELADEFFNSHSAVF